MEEYVKTLLAQVRCKAAHPYIESEIRGHLEDQIQTNLEDGMNAEEALSEALRDMGNPVECGTALDKVHRPALCLDLLLFMGGISILGILFQFFSGADLMSTRNYAVHTLFGFLAMLLVYHMDYSLLSSYAKLIAGAFNLLLLLAANNLFTVSLNHHVYYVRFGGIRLSLFALMLLYVPIYGALLYRYYNTGYKGFAKALAWIFVPCMLTLSIPNMGLAILLLYSLSLVLSLAIYKGWFQIAQKNVLICYWSALLSLPLLILAVAWRLDLLADYQKIRLETFCSNYGDAVFQISGQERIIGIFLAAILCFLLWKIFKISLSQRNQLGMIMGCSCGIVLLCNSVLTLLQSLGFLPTCQSFLPFFSTGGSTLFVSYLMIGIVLSIYRYKNIYPVNFHATPKLSFSLKITKTNGV